MTAGFREFEFDLPEALLAGMITAFDGMEGATLSHANLNGVPEAQGVYQLLLNNEIVYIGKTDAEAGLSRRLERHAWTIQHRRNLKTDDVSFKALRVFVFTAVDLETQLIRHYRNTITTPWNNSGFGSNDPGRNRDFTRAKPTSFDVLYPIDLDQEVGLDITGQVTVAEALQSLRRTLPYTLRIEPLATNSRLSHSDLELYSIRVQPKSMSARRLLTIALAALPAGWQATALAGRVIVYKESVEYPSGQIIARS